MLLNLNNMRNMCYRDHALRLEFSTFMQNLIKTQFPYSTTKNVLLTREEREKSYILGLHHRRAESSEEKGYVNYLRGVREERRRGEIFGSLRTTSCQFIPGNPKNA
ncbi:hypothetical protein DAPPUDRAFT_263981 [Daphnia pulex]|uniref:Uncharacterized protein n=1 Tax=Daphnia pulex TaxID=6669 RepID=E9HQQ5_DAPPU|nr:hypothetical protein DAPPUDRAFT_263981 [Daphnia pulex]|eukprot:EFX65938.1 hypothetical protein DAPPUDRAFT_263981 [Daphnia pulex]